MKKQISLTVGGKITIEKEKIIVEMFNGFGDFIRALRKDGMRIEYVSVTSEDVLDYDKK